MTVKELEDRMIGRKIVAIETVAADYQNPPQSFAAEVLILDDGTRLMARDHHDGAGIYPSEPTKIGQS